MFPIGLVKPKTQKRGRLEWRSLGTPGSGR